MEKKQKVLSLLTETAKAYQKHHYDDAYRLVQQAVTIASSIKDKELLAKARKVLGKVYEFMANYEQSLASYFKALDYYKKENVLSEVVSLYRHIGNIFYYLGSEEKAFKFFSDALALSSPKIDKHYGRILNNLSVILIEQKKYDEAQKYLDESREFYLDSGSIENYTTALINLADLLLQKEEYDQSIAYWEEAIAYAKFDRWKLGLVHGEHGIGEAYAKIGDYERALKSQFRALKMAKEIQLTERFPIIYKTISSIYRELNDTKNAYIYLKKHYYEKQKTQDQVKQHRILEMEAQFRLKIQENEKFYFESQSETLTNAIENMQKAYRDLKKAQEQLVLEEQKSAVLELAIETTTQINAAVCNIQKNYFELKKIFPEELFKANVFLQKIASAINRIEGIVKQLQHIEDIEFTPYSSQTNMIRLQKDC